MEGAAEQLEVVARHQERPDDDEHAQPGRDLDHAVDAERDRAGEPGDRDRDEHRVGDPRAQRPTMQLIERVRGEPHRQQEGEQGLAQPPQSTSGASDAPITTYDRCHTVYGGWSSSTNRATPGASA